MRCWGRSGEAGYLQGQFPKALRVPPQSRHPFARDRANTRSAPTATTPSSDDAGSGTGITIASVWLSPALIALALPAVPSTDSGAVA